MGETQEERHVVCCFSLSHTTATGVCPGRGSPHGVLLLFKPILLQLQRSRASYPTRRYVHPQVRYRVCCCGPPRWRSGMHPSSGILHPGCRVGGVGLVEPTAIDQDTLAVLQPLAKVCGCALECAFTFVNVACRWSKQRGRWCCRPRLSLVVVYFHVLYSCQEPGSGDSSF